MLVKVLTGVFDPPPDVLTVRWGYLSAVVLITVGTVAAPGRRRSRAAPPGDRGLRDL
jgi:putative ABC transport system permease protein